MPQHLRARPRGERQTAVGVSLGAHGDALHSYGAPSGVLVVEDHVAAGVVDPLDEDRAVLVKVAHAFVGRHVIDAVEVHGVGTPGGIHLGVHPGLEEILRDVRGSGDRARAVVHRVGVGLLERRGVRDKPLGVLCVAPVLDRLLFRGERGGRVRAELGGARGPLRFLLRIEHVDAGDELAASVHLLQSLLLTHGEYLFPGHQPARHHVRFGFLVLLPEALGSFLSFHSLSLEDRGVVAGSGVLRRHFIRPVEVSTGGIGHHLVVSHRMWSAGGCSRLRASYLWS